MEDKQEQIEVGRKVKGERRAKKNTEIGATHLNISMNSVLGM